MIIGLSISVIILLVVNIILLKLTKLKTLEKLYPKSINEYSKSVLAGFAGGLMVFFLSTLNDKDITKLSFWVWIFVIFLFSMVIYLYFANVYVKTSKNK